MRDDLTVVVSPLVSLMQDQVSALEARRTGAGGADQRPAGPRRQLGCRRAGAVAGEVRLLYVAPERFSARGFFEKLRAAPIGLSSSWTRRTASRSGGHDFRPDYFRLARRGRARSGYGP